MVLRGRFISLCVGIFMVRLWTRLNDGAGVKGRKIFFKIPQSILKTTDKNSTVFPKQQKNYDGAGVNGRNLKKNPAVFLTTTEKKFYSAVFGKTVEKYLNFRFPEKQQKIFSAVHTCTIVAW